MNKELLHGSFFVIICQSFDDRGFIVYDRIQNCLSISILDWDTIEQGLYHFTFKDFGHDW